MNAAVQSLLQHPSIWLGGQLEHASTACLSTSFAALDAQLPGGGWPLGALTELLYPHEGIGEISLLLPTFAQLNREGRGVVWIMPAHAAKNISGAHFPYCPYAP